MEKGKFWSSADYSLYFKANDNNLNFNHRNLNANDNYSGGLLLLGLCLEKNMGARLRSHIAL